VITGHSLGGAVSPVVSLWLEDTQPSWNPGGRARLSCFAFAGPTAGNAEFARYAGSRLGDRIHRVANSLDISPLGWGQEGLERSKSIYAPIIPASPQINQEVDVLKRRARNIDYRHVDPDAAPLPGRLNTSITSFTLSTYENYLIQQHYQHSEAYFGLLGIPEYVNYQWLCSIALRPLAIGSYVTSLRLFEYEVYLDELAGR
jgi:hypothetical protein